MAETFLQPPRLFNELGIKRRVGFELEFGGLKLSEAARIVLNLFCGEMVQEKDYSYKVATPIGEFILEADSNFLLEKKSGRILRNIGLDPKRSLLGLNVEGAVNSIAEKLLPFEIVTPPFPIDRLEDIERIRRELQRHSAKGTKSSWFTAFAMQFNPEVPDKKVETLVSILRAFFLLFDWLHQESEIALARRLSPFIRDFPRSYMDQVLDPAYRPTLNRFMADYLVHNPTRNRPLDLLPLFADIDKEKLFSHPVEKDLIKARPTFHYRLPNSQVDDPNWTIAEDWNKWVEVERLAHDQSRLRRMSEDYFRTKEEAPVFSRRKWIEKTRDWLQA